MILITSRANPHYKSWLHLLRSPTRKKSGLFLIEGFRELSRAFKANVSVQEVVMSEAALQLPEVNAWFQALPDSIQTYQLSNELFASLSRRDHPDGLLGVAALKQLDWDAKHINPNGLYLLVEHLEKPGNLGALIRSAEAAAVDAILLADPGVDLFNPHVIRASQGAVFQLPVYCQPASVFQACLQASHLALWATAPKAERIYWDCDFTLGSVICIGNEAVGLNPQWLAMATPISIPMYGQSADSLNAAVAGALCLYEARRQRRRAGL